MLGRYDDPAPCRILGIDPGTNKLGVSVLDVCLATNAISLRFSQTFDGHVMSRDYRYVSRVHGDKVARLEAHRENLYILLTHWQPHEVVSEAPYLGRFPAAYAALVECLTAVRHALSAYDWNMPLLTVDPPTAKNAVGVNGKSGDKDLMAAAVHRLVDLGFLLNPEGIVLSSLDEHSIDSIAVGYVRAKYLADMNTLR